VEKLSLSAQAKRLEKYIYNLPAARKLNMLKSNEREAMIKLRNSVSSAQGAIGIYSHSDDTKEQSEALVESKQQLKMVSTALIEASQYDLLNVTDVAHLSALTEQLIEQLG